MQRSVRRFQWLWCLPWLWLSISEAAASTLALADAVRQTGTVILIRHTIAPGFGDPDHFQLGDCSTQRNLSDAGRAQATALGAQFRAAGLSSAQVYSSPWCRCLETAERLGLGDVVPFDGLSSFFQGHADQRATMAALNRALSTWDFETEPTVMVTHQVVISALTGLTLGSGEAVLYDPRTGATHRIDIR